MANQSAPQGALQIDAATLVEILKEARKPYVDEQAEALKAKRREQLREANRQHIADQKLQQEYCSHLREDNTSAMAWMNSYPDKQFRGVCQRCNLLVEPEHPKYRQLLAIPTRQNVSVGL